MNTSNTEHTQLVVIGAGPGGYAAAFHAAELGMEVTLVNEEPQPGGVCLRRGCIPSKALLHAGALIREAAQAEAWGLKFDKPAIDLEKLAAWKNSVVEKLSQGISNLCERRHVRYLAARATFESPDTIALEPVEKKQDIPRTLRFSQAIIATGSSHIIPSALKIADARVMNATDALELQEIPGSLLIIGGGYIGLEIGTIYSALGSRVTVVDMLDKLLPQVDRDLVRPLKVQLDGYFEAIHFNTKVRTITPAHTQLRAAFEGDLQDEMAFDRILVATGRYPRTQGVGLENTAITLDADGFIQTNDRCRTDEPTIHAIGDAAGQPMLAHKASHEAKVAVEDIAGYPAKPSRAVIPAVVFTDPQIAWCGLTETDARAQGRKVAGVRFPWAASGRAATLNRTEGITKLVIDPETERILGVGITGPEAGELIAEGTLAVAQGLTVSQLAECIHPHPTLSETLHEAAGAFFGLATHIYRPKRKPR